MIVFQKLIYGSILVTLHITVSHLYNQKLALLV